MTLRGWVRRCLEGSTNANIVNERLYGRRWSLYFDGRLLTDISTEDLRRMQAKIRSKMRIDRKTKQSRRQWSDSTINRHFSFLRHIYALAVQDGKAPRNPGHRRYLLCRTTPDTLLQ
jgi:hypothetical protein